MKVPYRLRRTAHTRPTKALLIPGQEAAVVLKLCARLGIDVPRIFAVVDGFLLRLAQPLDKPVAGTIRLAELSSNLLLPVDAELVPTLLADEAEVLVRHRGLIFLPAGRVLEFTPAEPIRLAALVTIISLRRHTWQAMPEPRSCAPRINEIVFHRPEDLPDAIIERGGEGIAEEESRPDDTSLPKKVLGQSAMGLGQALRWLGSKLQIQALANLGGNLMAGGLSTVPRLSEKIMGKQEAGLRELLEEFRKGNIEKALRRALPLGGSGARGAVPHQGSQLPTHNLGYSLGNIMSGWGPASLWYSPDEVFHELQREYRIQAEAAVQRGDFRRAAFIYGKLLADYAMAATVLAQGGLHHDAAILYLKRLQNHLAAAREFEAAGEFDDALRLYRQRHHHVNAGDLLRRMGEDELAIAEYRQAADLLVANGQGHLQAGELMLTIVQRPDLAEPYFTAGWQTRPHFGAVRCASHLAEHHAQNGDSLALLRLTDEAQDFFQSRANDSSAAEFCNLVARLAERPALASVQEELRDRCLMTLTHQLRQGSHNVGQLASQLFRPGSVWEAPLVDDAHFAARIANQRGAPWLTNAPVNTVVIQAQIAIVRSICHASESGDIFLGCESGEIACFNPQTDGIHYLPRQSGQVVGLTADAEATHLVTLCLDEDGVHHHLSSYVRLAQQWQLAETRSVGLSQGGWLCPTIVHTCERFAVLFDGARSELQYLRLPRLLPAASIAVQGGYPLTALPISFCETDPCAESGHQRAECLVFDGRDVGHVTNAQGDMNRTQTVLCNFPGQMTSSSLDTTPLSWFFNRNRLELAGLCANGALTWLELEFQAGKWNTTKCKSATGTFRAAALIRHGVIAAIGNEGISWLRVGESGINEQFRQRMSFPDIVACFSDRDRHELIIISGNGVIARVRHAV